MESIDLQKTYFFPIMELKVGQSWMKSFAPRSIAEQAIRSTSSGEDLPFLGFTDRPKGHVERVEALKISVFLFAKDSRCGEYRGRFGTRFLNVRG